MVNVEKFITGARVKLLMEHPFYGHVIMQLPVVYSNCVPTLGVGKTNKTEITTKLFINPDYVRKIVDQCQDNKRLMYSHFFEVLKHEVLHFIFGHLTIELHDHHRQQIACELSVNSYVNRDGLVPESEDGRAGVFPEDFGLEPKKSMKEYYDLLNGNEKYNQLFQTRFELQMKLGDLAKRQRQLSEDTKNSDGSNMDELSKRQEELSKETESLMKQAAGNKDTEQAMQEARSSQSDAEDSLGDKDTNSASGQMAEAADKLQKASDSCGTMMNVGELLDSHEKWKAVAGDDLTAEMVKDIIRQAADACKQTNQWGDVPGEIMDAISDCYANKREIIPWEVVLKDFLASSAENILDYTMKRKSKRYDTRPGTKKDDVLSVAIGIDTSGSIDNDLLNLFFNELHWISKTGTKMTVFEWDTQVNREYDFSEFDGKVTGRGGTDPTDFLEKMSERKFDCAIIFTDLYFSDIEKEYGVPMLWVADNDYIGRDGDYGHIPIKEGMILKVNKERDGFELVDR